MPANGRWDLIRAFKELRTWHCTFHTEEMVPLHNMQPTKSTNLVLRYLYYILTLSIPTCYSIIYLSKEKLSIFLVECCKLFILMAWNKHHIVLAFVFICI